MRIAIGSSNAISWKVAALAIATILALATTACDRFSVFDRIGVSIGDHGLVQILYLACDYERLAAVALYDSKNPTTGEDDEPLWQIRSEDGGDGGVFTVSSQPQGYVETVAFEGELPENLVAAVEIEGSIGAAISFTPTDLEPGMVFSSSNPSSNTDADAFAQRARESCQSP